MVTDQSQAVVWQTEQTPFGEVTQTTGTLAQPLRFPGQYADPETGYSYNYFRDYDPSVGRYVQSDPIGLRGGLNGYAYVGGNPIRFYDPLGLEPWVFDGNGDTSVCSYYDQRASGPDCDYYNNAAAICRGSNSLVNAVINLGIIDAWLRGNTTASQSEILNQIRNSLIGYDQIARALNRSGNGPLRGDLIDLYHNMAFSNAGISNFWYGGNRWPQGIPPNPVPYDPIGNSQFDPRN